MSLSHAIMTALLEEELTGYELAKKFDVSLGFFWGASHQQIYQELKQLNNNRLISGEDVDQQGKPNKRVYALTELGRENLDHWVLGETKVKPGKDELLVKLYNIGHSQKNHILDHLKDRRREHETRLALYRKIESRQYLEPKKLPLNKKGIYLALLGGILQSETAIEWCDSSINLLSD
ncbi:MAG: DNA-binding PadR family transcriptional regulator [Candidatus Azotimanducaceae bacterium]|jgi:DNA-binding PadR family transcriptional regulator